MHKDPHRVHGHTHEYQRNHIHIKTHSPQGHTCTVTHSIVCASDFQASDMHRYHAQAQILIHVAWCPKHQPHEYNYQGHSRHSDTHKQHTFLQIPSLTSQTQGHQCYTCGPPAGTVTKCAHSDRLPLQDTSHGVMMYPHTMSKP